MNMFILRPDSNILGRNVHMVRKRFGRRLAEEHPLEADIVTGVPDRRSRASGAAEQLGCPTKWVLLKPLYRPDFYRAFLEIRPWGCS